MVLVTLKGTNSKELLRDALTDIQVIIKRLEARYGQLQEGTKSLSIQAERLSKEIEEAEEKTKTEKGIRPLAFRSTIASDRHSLDKAIEKREDLSSKLELLQNSKFAIVLTPEVNELRTKAIEQYNAMDKKILLLPLYVGDTSGIQIADLDIPFRYPTL